MSALESLHRYTRLTLLSTTALVGGIPLLIGLGASSDRLSLVVVVVGALPFVVLHWRRVEQAVADPAEVRSVRSTVVSLAMATAPKASRRRTILQLGTMAFLWRGKKRPTNFLHRAFQSSYRQTPKTSCANLSPEC